MYRLIICELPRIDGKRRFRIRSKNGKTMKLFSIDQGPGGKFTDGFYKEAGMLRMYRKCREAIRDCLYAQFGSDWKKQEIKHMAYIQKSIFSALKRLKRWGNLKDSRPSNNWSMDR